MQAILAIIGAATASSTVAVTVVLWINAKFETQQAIANTRHEENLERFKNLTISFTRLETRIEANGRNHKV